MSLQPFEIMDWFSGVPSGNFLISLDHGESCSPTEEDDAHDLVLDLDSEAETIPGEIPCTPTIESIEVESSCTPTIESIEIEDSCTPTFELVEVNDTEVMLLDSESSSEVELVHFHHVENDPEPDLWTSEKENELMKEEERYGYFHRVQARQIAVEARLRSISEAIASESPEDRQIRRRRFYEALHGVRPW